MGPRLCPRMTLHAIIPYFAREVNEIVTVNGPEASPFRVSVVFISSWRLSSLPAPHKDLEAGVKGPVLDKLLMLGTVAARHGVQRGTSRAEISTGYRM